MAVMFVTMDGGMEKRYDICSYSSESLNACSLMHSILHLVDAYLVCKFRISRCK